MIVALTRSRLQPSQFVIAVLMLVMVAMTAWTTTGQAIGTFQRSFARIFLAMSLLVWMQAIPSAGWRSYELALPVDARTLARAGLISLSISALLPCALGLLLLLVFGVHTETSWLLVGIVGSISCGLQHQVSRGAWRRQPASIKRVGQIKWVSESAGALGLGGVLLMWNWSTPGPWAAGVSVIAAASIFVVLWHRHPEPFQFDRQEATDDAHQPGGRSVLRLQLGRSVAPFLHACLMLTVIGWFPHSSGFFAGFMVMILHMSTLRSLLWLPSSLPLPPGPRLALALAPTLLAAIVAGLLFTCLPRMDGPHGRAAVGTSMLDGALYTDLRPSDSLWRFCLGGVAPASTAPNGESFRPAVQVVVPGLSLFNPYAIGPESSIAFATWQAQRLVRAWSGEAVDAERIERRLLTVDQEGSVQHRIEDQKNGQRIGRNLADAFPDLARSGFGWRDGIGMSLIWLLLWASCAWVTLRRRCYPLLPKGLRSRLVEYLGVGGFSVAVLWTIALVSTLRPTNFRAFSVLRRAMGSALVDHPVIASLTLGVALALLFFALLRRFRVMEQPPFSRFNQGKPS